MDEVEDDVDAALTWKALQDEDVSVAAVDASDVINVPPVDDEDMTGVASAVEEDEEVDEDEDDDDVADFVQLADLPPYTDGVDAATPTLEGSDSHAVGSEDTGVIHVAAASPPMAAVARFKRKNFSKHLQFLCLQRYADHVKTQGALPNRSECQLLLHQSFAQFVREGGSADHPRLSYPEFLKLIRNRSRERQERLARTNAETTQLHKVGLSGGATQATAGPISRQGSSKSTKSRRGSRKRKWTEEVVKIDELIEVIDKARRRATGLASVPHGEPGFSASRGPHRHPTKSSLSSTAIGAVQNGAVAASSYSTSATAVIGLAESSDIVDSILKLQQETLSLQHVIKERLESIQEQCRHQEPASASITAFGGWKHSASRPILTMTTPAKPFVTRDVFRLLMRLEAQKTNDVDTQSLERRFRVPPGYGRDETDEQRERLAELITPGPGAYESQTIWKGRSDETTKPSAVFSSSAPRDPFQLEAIEKETAQLSPQRVTREDSRPSTYLQQPPLLGSFSKSQRGLESPQGQAKPSQPNQTETAKSTHVKKWATPGVSFERAPRATDAPIVPANPLGPSQYEIKRLWDKSRKTGVATPDLPSPAVFSASKEKRELVWSPAHGLSSNAVPEAWDASAHYAKHKRQVLLEQEKQRRKQEKAQQSRKQLSQSKSMPVLGSPSKVWGKKHADTHTESALDPFDWLRRLPHGEQRANALATKHGLSDLVRPAAVNSTKRVLHDGDVAGAALFQAVQTDGDDSSASESTCVAPLAPIGKHATDEDEGSSSRRGLFMTAEENQSNSSQSNERISVSCRLQGGFVITVKMYPAKRVRLLKSAIVRKQTRYQNEDQFDLYLGNGKLLTSMEDTLHQVGLRDRSLVQVVSK